MKLNRWKWHHNPHRRKNSHRRKSLLIHRSLALTSKEIHTFPQKTIQDSVTHLPSQRHEQKNTQQKNCRNLVPNSTTLIIPQKRFVTWIFWCELTRSFCQNRKLERSKQREEKTLEPRSIFCCTAGAHQSGRKSGPAFPENVPVQKIGGVVDLRLSSSCVGIHGFRWLSQGLGVARSDNRARKQENIYRRSRCDVVNVYWTLNLASDVALKWQVLWQYGPCPFYCEGPSRTSWLSLQLQETLKLVILCPRGLVKRIR